MSMNITFWNINEMVSLKLLISEPWKNLSPSAICWLISGPHFYLEGYDGSKSDPK